MNISRSWTCVLVVCAATVQVYAQNEIIQSTDTSGLDRKNNEDSLLLKGQLSNVVVKGKRPLVRREENKTVFEVSRMKNLGGMKGMDVLRYAPRVIVDDVTGSVKVGHEPATVYVNDRKLSSDEITGYLKGLNAADISRIEVRQSRGADQSADIQGGIVYIYTRQRPGVYGDIGLYGALPFEKNLYSWNPSAHLYFGTEKWNVYGSYEYSQARRTQDAYTENEFLLAGNAHISDGSLVSMQGSHTYKIGSVLNINPMQSLGIEFNGSNSGINRYNSLTNETFISSDGKVYDGLARGYYNEGNHFYNLAASYNWKLDKRGSFLKALFNYNDVNSQPCTHLTAVYDVYTLMNMDEENIPDATSRNLTGNLDFKKKFEKGWGLTAGGEYLTTKRNSDLTIVDKLASSATSSFSHYDYHEKIAAAYAGISKDFDGRLFMSFSMRMENTDLSGKSSEATGNVNKNYADWFPSIYMSYSVSDRLSYDFTYIRSILRPSFSQLNNYKSRLSEVMYEQGNPDLQRVLTDKVTLNVNFLSAHSVSVSYSRTPDAMVRFFNVENGNTTTYSTINYGTNESVLFDYSYNGNLFPWWQLNAQADVFYTRLPESNNRTHLWSGDVSLQNRFTFKKIGTFALNFVGCLPTIDGDTYAKGQWRLGISYSRSFFDNRLNLLGGVYNIFRSSRDWAYSLSPVLSYHFRGRWSTQMAYLSLTWNFSSHKKVSRQELENKNEIRNRM